jgi:hypothetical protein
MGKEEQGKDESSQNLMNSVRIRLTPAEGNEKVSERNVERLCVARFDNCMNSGED